MSDHIKLIQDLHRLATNESASEAEAQTALDKMQRLLFKHKLDLNNVLEQDKTNEPKVVEYTLRYSDLRVGRIMGRTWKYEQGKLSLPEREWRTRLVFDVAQACFCRGAKTSECTEVYFYGTKEDIEIAQVMWQFIVDQAQDLSYKGLKEVKKLHGKVNSKVWRQEFLIGLCDRVGTRLRETRRLLAAGSAAATALVVVSDKALNEYTSQFLSKTPGKSYSKSANWSGLGYQMGRAAGDKVVIGKPGISLKEG